MLKRASLSLVAGVLAVTAVTACHSSSSNAEKTGIGTASAAPAIGGGNYPQPRWPSYFKPATSAEDLMPAARLLVRNQSGLQGKGLGILAAGDSVLLVPGGNADPMVLDAINRALQERKITAHIKRTYELLGQTP